MQFTFLYICQRIPRTPCHRRGLTGMSAVTTAFNAFASVFVATAQTNLLGLWSGALGLNQRQGLLRRLALVLLVSYIRTEEYTFPDGRGKFKRR